MRFKAKEVLIRNGPFKMEPLAGKDCVSVLRLGCRLLDDLGLKYWLSAGTALGLHRDKDFIADDTDIDVEVLNLADRDKLVSEFLAAGFRLIREMTYEGRSQQLAFMHPAESIIFDIFCYIEQGENIINYNDAGMLVLPKKFIAQNEKQTTRFGDFYLPYPIEEYLDYRYKQWRKPEKKKDKDWRAMANNLVPGENDNLLRRLFWFGKK